MTATSALIISTTIATIAPSRTTNMETASPVTANGGMSKFPAFAPDVMAHTDDNNRRSTSSPERNPSLTLRQSLDNDAGTGRFQASSHWQSRRNSRAQASQSHIRLPSRGRGHGRQRSLSEAIQIIRERNGSMSQNAQEIADALKAPVSPRLVILCAAWYGMSMLANTSAGQILNTFPKPVTLTIVQFFFVSSWCLALSWLASLYPALKHHFPALRNGVRRPSRDLIMTTLPLTGFMIGGHILTSDAMSRIPVSLVHTIKGLSPLFTVFAYRFIFDVKYHYTTYLSLLPLTIGVIMACSTQFSNNFLGLLSAFSSAILFVTQNIVSKKLFSEAAAAELDIGPLKSRKPDKLNLLCYSSALAFAFTAPIWLWSEGIGIIGDFLFDASVDLEVHKNSLDHGALLLEYVFNGAFHFFQSLIAFTLLSMVSPVTYSVASLIKRVFVICFAIVWFGNKVTSVQAMGIALTFLGLYLYDRTSGHHAKAEKRQRLRDMPSLLPVHEVATPLVDKASFTESSMVANDAVFGGYRGEGAEEEKRREEASLTAQTRSEGNGWLAPGTKAEDTWNWVDASRRGVSVT
ncbi:uncharacterized protein PV09_09170 [Verruconis gallopava]|uniref:Sugar phosphate transporter domain-containing protein n=1 Tax=Verruconis gallopava TaxID=253628 RepID=A0A0D1ZYI9_9PEZI|nr:uncharacterized protein PV09_09170 [Verruconis gallopava]KIV99139.1 hypothetical protein PV09_09170 [Verruconis gallopava]